MPLRIIHATYVCFLIAAVLAERPNSPASQPDETELSAVSLKYKKNFFLIFKHSNLA